MNKINTAPRAPKNLGPSDDYKIMQCAQCGHNIIVATGYSSNDPVFCTECLPAILNLLEAPAPEREKPWWKIW